MGMPQLWQSRPEQDECGKKNLWIYWKSVLESGQNTGNKRKSITLIKSAFYKTVVTERTNNMVRSVRELKEKI